MSQYTVFVKPAVWKEIKKLPGNVRQRVKRAIDALKENATPPDSKKLKTPELEPQVHRLRLDKWRVVYLVDQIKELIHVVAVRKRPPYDYGDLAELIKGINT